MSLVALGTRKRGPDTPAGLVLACHERMRAFLTLAARVAAGDAPGPDIAEAASRLHRYFTVSLPLHVADEEQSIEPRLLAHVPALAAPIARMHDEHASTQRLLDALTPVWARAADLASTATGVAQLDRDLRAH